MSEKTVVKEEIKHNIKKPKLYQVLMHNDDYTTMEFVVEILVAIFNKQPAEATRIMLDVHKCGIGIAGVYSYDIATTKVVQAESLAEEKGFPLKLSLREE
ncbi:ATP-dependent Clp protease adaptor ClpS [Clostridium omnivorum]|uniref:ATP-dependent Clp protease adapter protein ClpS n=1 Tax=Clostridium omnivorum TaxID=1604902 RepID=A0ABQ5N0Y9_9CLOT|nr:ATP-dependent Clp protease adaptor ClpS [Clostridium sp. E14]GLC28852.1 ATP-dependent Clp protease adapter protein ClpS [Clostridium sp. E14]